MQKCYILFIGPPPLCPLDLNRATLADLVSCKCNVNPSPLIEHIHFVQIGRKIHIVRLLELNCSKLQVHTLHQFSVNCLHSFTLHLWSQLKQIDDALQCTGSDSMLISLQRVLKFSSCILNADVFLRKSRWR